jgi:hypothetical protein
LQRFLLCEESGNVQLGSVTNPCFHATLIARGSLISKLEEIHDVCSTTYVLVIDIRFHQGKLAALKQSG